MSRHVPVLLNEVLGNLQLKPGMKVIDCTLGDGGHAEAILAKIGPPGKLLGLDADPEAALVAKRYLYKYGDQFIAVRDNFVNLKQIAEEHDFNSAQAILMDLGWSSTQFTGRGRGFSFQNQDEPLDMRYGAATTSHQTAADILNNFSEQELADIFHKYGQERLAKEIARAVIDKRKQAQISQVKQLVEIILQVYRAKLKTDKQLPWVGGLHPATRVFQALRVAVNNELEVLRQALPQAVELLAPSGRLAVISFHSLEDRIVKQYFRTQAGKTVKIINKKPIVASRTEVNANPRARSAKMRVAEKIFKIQQNFYVS